MVPSIHSTLHLEIAYRAAQVLKKRRKAVYICTYHASFAPPLATYHRNVTAFVLARAKPFVTSRSWGSAVAACVPHAAS